MLSQKERVGHNFNLDPSFPIHEGEQEGLMVAFISMENPLGSGIHPDKCVADGLVRWVKQEIIKGNHGDIYGAEEPINRNQRDVNLYPSNCHNMSPWLLSHISIEFSNETQVAMPWILK